MSSASNVNYTLWGIHTGRSGEADALFLKKQWICPVDNRHES